MFMPRFFIDDIPAGESVYTLAGENARHISRSLRMKTGDMLTVCTPLQMDCLCEITEITSDEVILKLLSQTENQSEPKTQITVYQCLPKSDKLETVAQKITELGAVKLVPVESSRCIAKAEKWEKKQARLQKIVLEAAKQSGRGKVLPVTFPLSLGEALKQAANEGEIIFFYEEGGEPLKSILREIPAASVIGIFIGPEGGFSEQEAMLAKAEGAKTATLGKRILRTETAAPAAVSMILYERDEMQ